MVSICQQVDASTKRVRSSTHPTFCVYRTGEIKVWALMENKPTKEKAKGEKEADILESKPEAQKELGPQAGRAVPTVPKFVIEVRS